AGAGDLDHVATPAAFGPIELNERAVAAHPVPALERHVLHAPNADAAIDRNPLCSHVVVVGRVGPLPGAVSRVLQSFRLMPMGIGYIVHGYSSGGCASQHSCKSSRAKLVNRPLRPQRNAALRKFTAVACHRTPQPLGAPLSGTIGAPQVRGDKRCPRPRTISSARRSS